MAAKSSSWQEDIEQFQKAKIYTLRYDDNLCIVWPCLHCFSDRYHKQFCALLLEVLIRIDFEFVVKTCISLTLEASASATIWEVLNLVSNKNNILQLTIHI